MYYSYIDQEKYPRSLMLSKKAIWDGVVITVIFTFVMWPAVKVLSLSINHSRRIPNTEHCVNMHIEITYIWFLFQHITITSLVHREIQFYQLSKLVQNSIRRGEEELFSNK